MLSYQTVLFVFGVSTEPTVSKSAVKFGRLKAVEQVPRPSGFTLEHHLPRDKS